MNFQFNFLIILINLVLGLVLLAQHGQLPFVQFELDQKHSWRFYYILIGLAGIVIGLLHLLTGGGDIPIFGNFFPAVFALFSGCVVFFEKASHRDYLQNLFTKLKIPESVSTFLFKMANFVDSKRVFLGYATVTTGVLHVFLPNLIFF